MTDEIRPKDLALECPTEYGHHHAAHVGGGDGVLEQQQGHGDHGYPLGHNITILVSNKFSYENKIYI